jgi:hypothetical protein
MAWDCGAGCSFSFSLGCHLEMNQFPFPPSTAQTIGKVKNNKQCTTGLFPPVMLRQSIGAAIDAAQIGQALRT